MVVALQHLQLLQQGGELYGVVFLMLSLVLFVSRPLETDFL